MRFHSSKQNRGRIAAWATIVLIIAFIAFILITGVKAYHEEHNDAEATAKPEPTQKLMVIERTEIHTEYVPVPERIEVRVPVEVEKIVEVPVEVPVEVTTYVQVPVVLKEGTQNRYSAMELSAYDLELLARIAWREARGEKAIGMRMVIEVVLNRVLSSQFPDTVEGVLYQKGQFAQGDGVPSLEEIVPTQDQYDAVSLVMNETPITDADVYFFATTALTDNVFMRVGGHFFCRNGNW